MEEFKVKEFAAPDGVQLDDDTRELFGAIQGWLQTAFSDFVKSSRSGEDYAKAIGEKMKEMGLDAEKTRKWEEALKEQGKILEKLRMGASESGQTTRADVLKKFIKERHEDIVKAFSKKEQFAFEIPVNKDASVITTTTAVSSTTGAQWRGYTERDPEFYYTRRGRQYIRDVADVRRVRRVPTTMEFWEEGAEDGAFAVVDENGLKPLVDVSLVLNMAKKKKAAGMMTLTEEVIMDSDELALNLERLFVDKLWRDYEDGLTASLLGSATSYTSTSLNGTIENPNDFDAISAAALQVASLNFRPTDLILNTSDAYAMSLIKDGLGRYILPVVTDGGRLTIRSLRVTTTTKLAQGEFLVGEYGTWKVREGEAILRSGLNEDDFKYNRMSFIGEVFYNSYIPTNHTGSWVKGNFATIKEALKKAESSKE